jgi:predicted DNA-binding transcriptional regulator YafY
MLLGVGPEIKVLAPAALRTRLRELATQVAKHAARR